MKKSLMILMVIPAMALAYSGGPPDGRTGAPGELTCQNSCHSSFPLNSGDGSLTISGPAQFEPDMTYSITVELSDIGQSRWGFEITPLTEGSVNITDATNTQLSISNGKSYVKHTSTGTYQGNSNGPVNWSFDWTAPSNPSDSIIFYAAGNAANNNFSNSGDYIYTTSFTSYLNSTAVDDDPFASLPSHFESGNYPNPFNANTAINYNLPYAGHVTLEIFDIRGRMVESLADGFQDAGQNVHYWDASEMPSGVYFFNLVFDNMRDSKKMVLIK
ncbi:MAG: choice-of-anchor V domain-containing protein [candidate division Zixibacteria bacterium]